MRDFRSIAGALMAVLLLSACTSTKTLKTTNEFKRIDGEATLLLLEPDVELRFVKASEVRETRADWTEAAELMLLSELEKQLKARNISMTQFELGEATPREIQLIKLHEAVGTTIVLHRYANLPLPSKKDTFDWSLGPGVQEMARNNDADYALLLYARGEYASAGKQVANILMGAAFGVTGSMGGQQAFASLIDLRTGDIVWFNVAQTGVGSDMRDADGAEHMITNLLKKFPL
ncbi:hypothetical protein [Parvularcula sp. LCG005]|uniref:hypothetical protein n=1 Tax=Parvularcula sp. LCG005 TaxID=3078805 RepID=UPI00294238C5|nr:hypothetical protein [Parvularcula sp. LCG005]WOI51985.1 hypothetical protein RUI03_07425 [Parvularcula sp. LCG005]